jgi:hypothetical protein
MCRKRLSPRLVDMDTDYSISVLVEQRRQDFIAEAANDRLARIATADRTSWWLRLGRALLPESTVTPSLTARHRVAH